MRKYYINNREVTKIEWQDYFQTHADASVIIRADKLPPLYQPPNFSDQPVQPEIAKQIRLQFSKT